MSVFARSGRHASSLRRRTGRHAGAGSGRIVFRGLLVFATALGFGSPAPASPVRFAGSWLVVPRYDPDHPSPGGIPRAFLFRRTTHGFAGTFRWNASDYRLSSFITTRDRLIFRATFGAQRYWMIAKLAPHRDTIDVWVGKKEEGVAPFLARRIAPAALEKMFAAAPHPELMEKLPLPPIRELPPNGLAKTPPLGWNSWNLFREGVSDGAVRTIADALVSTGLRDAGYIYLTIDDGWQGYRDASGELHPNAKFPDMRALVEYVHARGLKFGLYSSPGPVTCAGFIGSHGHEQQDAQMFAAWGIDFLKYDLCSANDIYSGRDEVQRLYQKMGEALRMSGRAIVFSLCEYGLDDVSHWGKAAGGNMWRTGDDTVEGDPWTAVADRFDKDGSPDGAGPGGWNDADMMLMGLGKLNPREEQTHMTLWAMLASPIILGNDIRHMSQQTRRLLTDSEVLAIDQDPLGVQGQRLSKKGAVEIWTKPLADGSIALAIFNRGAARARTRLSFKELGLGTSLEARDLWAHHNLGQIASFQTVIPSHGTVLLRLRALLGAKGS